MATELYFDTARLGRMCRGAYSAERGFTKLARQLGSSLYFEQFLADGHESLPKQLRDRLPGLQSWHGVSELKHGLKRFVSLPVDGSALLASQSRTLITLAAECLFDRCERVLATDLEWPPYLAALKRTAVRHGKQLHVTRVRQQVLTCSLAKTALIEKVVDAYREGGSDGLFLSDVTHTGVRMPSREIIQAIPAAVRPRFTVIDGAQALAHRPLRLDSLGADLYLAGTQKWFGGYHPLRMAFVSADAGDVRTAMRNLIVSGLVCDPLYELLEAVEMGMQSRFGETVNLVALMTAAGALAQWNADASQVQHTWRIRQYNRRQVIRSVSQVATSVIHESLASGSLLLQVGPARREAFTFRNSLRQDLAQYQIVASEPLPGLVRLAMPSQQIRPQWTARLREALRSISSRKDIDEAVGRSIRASQERLPELTSLPCQDGLFP